MMISYLKHILFFIGMGFTNPVFPDLGSQFLSSVFIGSILPGKIITPINSILISIPYLNEGIEWFENKLENHDRLKTAFPRILAGYFFTYLIGFVCLLIYFLVFGGFKL